MSHKDLTEEFGQALSKKNAELSNISARRCSSGRFDGVEYTFYGEYVPIRPIIDVVAETDGYKIEQFSHIDDGEPRLAVFIAEFGGDPHPAFV